MKKVSFICLLVFLICTKVDAQLTMSVSPGLNINGAAVGYKLADRFVPFVSFRFLRASVSEEYKGFEYSAVIPGKIDPVEYTDKVNMNFMLPTIGLKTFLISRNKLKTYLSISASKPILTGKYEQDGVTDPQVKDELKKLKLFAGEVGFGMEYFFDDNFSLGGEFGIRYFKVKYDDEGTNTIWDPFTGLSTASTWEDTYRFTASPTFSKISLNFYF